MTQGLVAQILVASLFVIPYAWVAIFERRNDV